MGWRPTNCAAGPLLRPAPMLLLLLVLVLLTASGYITGGSGTIIHKITHTHTQNNTQHTKLQTQCTQNYKHNTTQ
jgi:hypothetical protein